MTVFTKIICTIGPAVDSVEKMVRLIESGMNVARMNFSHGDHKQHLKTIQNLKKAREITQKPLAIMLDTRGPEIRVGKLVDGALDLKAMQRIKLVGKFSNKIDEVPIDPFSIKKCFKNNMTVLFDDGYIGGKVISITSSYVLIEITNPGILKSGKKLNIPEAVLNLPSMTPQDIKDIKFGCQNDIDLVAASFIRSAEQVLQIKKLLFQLNNEIPVIAKIESKEGLENFDSILEVVDGIMVARGDLGVEIDLAQVPKYQKMMIRKSNDQFKPVVTATQMLESMINNPRPTRAEVSDVANAIYDSTASVMLSAETAVGKYPFEATKVMQSIIKEAEQDFNYELFFKEQSTNLINDISSSVTLAAVKTAYSSHAKAIFVYTTSGFTARLISRWRPRIPIIALTKNKKTFHKLSFYWGVIPVYTKNCKNANQAFNIMSKYAIDQNIASFGDLIVVTAGTPFGKKGSTNLMMLDSIGHILVRGSNSTGPKIEGELRVVRTADYKKQEIEGKILVIPRCDKSYLPLIRKAKGLILQNTSGDTSSEKYAMKVAKQFKMSLIVGAENAMTLLKEGEKIVLDTEKKLIYLPKTYF